MSPIVSYPVKAYDKAVEFAKCIADNDGGVMEDWYEAETAGFFEGLRTCLPSEVVGMLVMAHDDALEQFRKLKAESES